VKPGTPPGRHRVIEGSEEALAAGLSDLFIELDVRVRTGSRSARMLVDTRTFGDLELLHTNVVRGGFSVLRSQAHIASSASNSFFVGCVLDGVASFTQESRSVALQASDLAVLDSTRPYRIDVDRYLDALWIRVPRHRIEGRMPRAAEVLAQRIDGSVGTGHLTSTLVTASQREAANLSASESLRISNSLLDLLSLSLEVSGSQEDRRPLQILRRIQNHIDANIADPGLSRDSIARSHGISTRYLSKIFEREGLSVARWIRLRRLELSRQRIEARGSGAATISEIAFACGFTDVSSFNRAFKRHFGATPSSLRRSRFEAGGIRGHST
jgi:AraC-like DNA-binding protein